jgi:hypothetical protein
MSKTNRKSRSWEDDGDDGYTKQREQFHDRKRQRKLKNLLRSTDVEKLLETDDAIL